MESMIESLEWTAEDELAAGKQTINSLFFSSEWEEKWNWWIWLQLAAQENEWEQIKWVYEFDLGGFTSRGEQTKQAAIQKLQFLMEAAAVWMMKAISLFSLWLVGYGRPKRQWLRQEKRTRRREIDWFMKTKPRKWMNKPTPSWAAVDWWMNEKNESSNKAERSCVCEWGAKAVASAAVSESKQIQSIAGPPQVPQLMDEFVFFLCCSIKEINYCGLWAGGPSAARQLRSIVFIKQFHSMPLAPSSLIKKRRRAEQMSLLLVEERE